MFRENILKLFGRIILALNIGRRKFKSDSIMIDSGLDKTGRLVTKACSFPLLYRNYGIYFSLYDRNIAHSLWRAQEFTLFNNHRKLLQNPILDFGCGDGSFSSVLFDYLDYGFDIDAQALKVAQSYSIYGSLHSPANDGSIPLGDCSVQSIFCNSVLEHTESLEQVVREFFRILQLNGNLVFTVPVKQFTRDLNKYFGESESSRINNAYYHRNLLEVDEWKSLLHEIGFEVKMLISYQPDWFTFLYRFLCARGIGRISNMFIKHYSSVFRKPIVKIINKSIHSTRNGGNIFVVAQKV